MEARDFAELLKEALETSDLLHQIGIPVEKTRWGYGDSDFFLDVEESGTFIVSVVKVAE